MLEIMNKENSMSKEKRFVIQVDSLEIEDDAIFDNKELRLYECQSDMMSDICSLLNQQDQQIAELEEQLANSIRPKFSRQEHICGFAFVEIKEYIVIAYLDNDITLCEDTTTSKLEWCDNKFLVLTKEEAEAKLKELEEQK